MRITFTCNNLNNGGAERVICNLANQMVKDGFDVRIICLKVMPSFYYPLDDKVEVIEIDKKNINKISKEKMNIKERKGALLLYNSKKIIEIYRVIDHTFINIALYSPGKLNSILKDYE